MKLLIPTWTTVAGVDRKEYPDPADVPDDLIFFGCFKSFGGTEREVNGAYVIEDTATVETWFRPEIQSDCRVAMLNSGAVYEILGSPENIEMRNQFLQFKVRRVRGRA